MPSWIQLALLLAAPYLLAVASRHAALRGAAAGVTTSWFDFLQRIQWIGFGFVACWACSWPGLGSPLVTPGLTSQGLVAWTTPAMIAWLLIPIIAFQIFAAMLLHGVNRAIRGAEVTEREVLTESLRSLAGVGIVMVAMFATLATLSAGQWRVALGTALGGILGGVMLGARPGSRVRFAPIAITHGELRDRLFALATRAGVRVKQLYVVPLARTRIANAVAVQGESVMLTDYLLAHLSRDELDAVLAHELAHLRRHHPTLLGVTLIVGGMGVWSVYASAGPLAGAAAFVAMILTFMAVSRRFEYDADAHALTLGIRPQSLVTALGRLAHLNHMPQDWSRLREWTLTHPSNRRRALAIARHGSVPPELVDAMLTDAPVPLDRHDVPAQVHEGRMFTTTFKTRTLQRNAWAMLFGNAVASAAFAWSAAGIGVLDRIGILGLVPIGFLAFVATFALMQYLAMRPYRSLRAALWNRSSPSPPPAVTSWVGLSPGAEPRLYEGFATWDVGFSTLEPERFVYRGEETSFSLARDEIVAVEPGARYPGWVPVFGVTVRWRRGTASGCFTLFPVEANGLISYASASRRLLARLETWRTGAPRVRDTDPRAVPPSGINGAAADATYPPQPIPIAPPPTGAVTGTAPGDMVKPQAVFLTVFLQLAISAGAAVLMGLDARPRTALAIPVAVLASLLAYVLLITPLLRARRAARTTDAGETRRAA